MRMGESAGETMIVPGGRLTSDFLLQTHSATYRRAVARSASIPPGNSSFLFNRRIKRFPKNGNEFCFFYLVPFNR
jgi:hypothetical protein